MTTPRGPLLALPVLLSAGCAAVWPDIVSCEDVTACETTGPSSGAVTPTSGGVHTVTGDGDGGTTTGGTTGAGTTGAVDADEPPAIVEAVVIPEYVDEPGFVDVEVAVAHADGVRMATDDAAPVELAWLRPGKFGGQIPVLTGLDNGPHALWLTPWRDALEGAAVAAEYVVALPDPGEQRFWESEEDGMVAAIAVLPDGRPVAFVTRTEMNAPRCYLHLREADGTGVEVVPVLEPAHCRAIDLAIDRTSGVIHLLLERKGGDGLRWWAGEISGWGAAPQPLATGEDGDTAHALASRAGTVAVCGTRPVATADEHDALAVVIRPGESPATQLLDYRQQVDKDDHLFGEIVHDCKFAGDDTLVFAGGVWGKHEGEMKPPYERLFVVEYDLAADESAWIVASPGPGVQSRALAVDVDDEGRYHLAGHTCGAVCVPELDYRVYAPGGELVDKVSLDPLGSDLFGPHDLAWSPAGYSVVALGGLVGESTVFKVQAFAPGSEEALWTFQVLDPQAVPVALAVAVGPLGEVYAGGVGPTFAVIGG